MFENGPGAVQLCLLWSPGLKRREEGHVVAAVEEEEEEEEEGRVDKKGHESNTPTYFHLPTSPSSPSDLPSPFLPINPFQPLHSPPTLPCFPHSPLLFHPSVPSLSVLSTPFHSFPLPLHILAVAVNLSISFFPLFYLRFLLSKDS
ncbi:hypothetical protein E2C01_100072 [Portunus trituberculatus]|uniref:Uncharacterized protein n=1 Tax=Portunus trituberculatus TaxID=210409 RepID=A0A5B7KCK4_PORTR|nr:hypothetical protein [Portunus trituberculatus]